MSHRARIYAKSIDDCFDALVLSRSIEGSHDANLLNGILDQAAKTPKHEKRCRPRVPKRPLSTSTFTRRQPHFLSLN